MKLSNVYGGGAYESIKVRFSDERHEANAKKDRGNSCFAWDEPGLLLLVHPRPNREIASAGDRPTET